jgi:hypothetical protein
MVLATPGALENFTQSGDTFGENSSVWIRMSQPSSDNLGQYLSVLGTFEPASAGSHSQPGVGLLRSLDGGKTWAVMAGAGQSVGGSDSIWIDLGYPVQKSTSPGLAFRAKTKGSEQPLSDGIWWLARSWGPLQRMARTGSQAAECAAGEKWLAFKSLALPGGATGPLFVATINSLGDRHTRGKSDTGVWAVDRGGAPRLLFREGTTAIEGNTVKTFTS